MTENFHFFCYRSSWLFLFYTIGENCKYMSDFFNNKARFGIIIIYNYWITVLRKLLVMAVFIHRKPEKCNFNYRKEDIGYG